MSNRVIINAKIVTPENIINNGVIVIENGRIARFGSYENVKPPDNAEIIDVKGYYAAPGFIDIHCHGGGSEEFHTDPEVAAEAHLKHGTTSVLATIAYNVSKVDTIEGIKKIKELKNSGKGKSILGIHFEGPYTNPKYGALSQLGRKPDPSEYNTFIDLAGDLIKVWTLAPELEGIDDFIETVSSKGIVMSVGHSEASPERIFELIPKGLKLACHCMNATGCSISPSRFGGTREVGVDEAVLLSDDIYAEVIPDYMGVHVRPLMLRLILKAKTPDKMIIITDSTISDNKSHINNSPLNNSDFTKATDVNFNELGQLSGSILTMDKACRNMLRHTGVGIVDVFKMASYNQARLLNMEKEIGNIREGAKANIIIVDDDINVKMVMLEGELV
ncbi:MAG TPA: N-acetylglucosamine-6-phosphate deacetylase [Clostridiaceae bacterium]|nr:N-acetylglucosamine-6-phosphate deacetylase [Clostridiaceae bacterium]